MVYFNRTERESEKCLSSKITVLSLRIRNTYCIIATNVTTVDMLFHALGPVRELSWPSPR